MQWIVIDEHHRLARRQEFALEDDLGACRQRHFTQGRQRGVDRGEIARQHRLDEADRIANPSLWRLAIRFPIIPRPHVHFGFCRAN